MADRYEVATDLVELCETPRDVEVLRATIETVYYRTQSVTPERLAEAHHGGQTPADFRSLTYDMESSGVVSNDGTLDSRRLRDAVGCAKSLLDHGTGPENELVVNVPDGEQFPTGRGIGSLVVRLIELLGSAREEVVLLNPFFTDDMSARIVGPLASVVDGGASITLITRCLSYGDDDGSREFVRSLSSEGVDDARLNLYEYVDPDEESTATIHAKAALVDESRAYLGTANLTYRGLRDNLELGMILRDSTVAQLTAFVEELMQSDLLHEVTVTGGRFDRV